MLNLQNFIIIIIIFSLKLIIDIESIDFDETQIKNCFLNSTSNCLSSICSYVTLNSSFSSSQSFSLATTQINQQNQNCYIYSSCRKKLDIFNSFSNQLNFNLDATQNECSWYINFNETKNTVLYLKINKFSINQQFDYLYIYNGSSSNSQLLAALSGKLNENTVFIFNNIAPSPSLYIFFRRKSINTTYIPDLSIDYYLSNKKIDQTDFKSSIAAHKSTPLKDECINYLYDNNYDYINDVLNLKRGLHSTHLINKTRLYLIGGYSFIFLTRYLSDYYNDKETTVLDKNFNFVVKYDMRNDTLFDLDNSADDNEIFYGNTSDGYKLKPINRYSFSSIYDLNNNRILIFGGLLINTLYNDITAPVNIDSLLINYLLKVNQTSFHHITDELWSFDLKSKKWKLIDDVNAPSNERIPLGVCGHSSILFKDTMLTFFGFSRYYGHLSLIQELNLTSNQWFIRNLTNIPSLARFKSKFLIGYKHSSVINEKTNLIYLFGGLILSEEYFFDQKPIISNVLLEYNPLTHEMKVLKESRIPSYMHSAIIYNDVMIVTGGLIISPLTGELKVTKRIRFYNITENIWHNDGDRDSYGNLMINKERYSHTSFIYNDTKLCIQGGFDGIFMNDLFCINLDCLNINNVNYSLYEESTTTTVSISSTYDVFETASLSNITMLANLLEFKKCDYYLDCYSCQYNPQCIWYDSQCLYLYMFELRNDKKEVIDYLYEKKTCRKLCFKYNSCENCTQNSECMWCSNTNLCLQTEQFKVIYSFGQCYEYIHDSKQCISVSNSIPSINTNNGLQINTNYFGCLNFRNCSSCIEQENCGWCSLDNSKTGYGICIDAMANLNNDYTSKHYCPKTDWNFNSCPICECNGHSLCSISNTNTKTCLNCYNNTIGDRCSTCADGYYGSSLNNGICSKCNCNGHASQCDSNDGRCYCFTKGVIGKYCSQCEQPRYFGNPSEVNGTCYYDLSIDYQFTFNLNKEADKYYTKINFSNKPVRFDDDIDLTIKCVKYLNALFNVTYVLWYDYDLSLSTPSNNYRNYANNSLITTPTTLRTNEIQLLTAINCSSNEYKYTFTTKDDNYYLLNNLNQLNQKNAVIKNRTFYVYVYNFKTPIIIQISFTHKTRIQLLHFFVTFFGCFITLLAIAFILWKAKQRYDRYQRQRRLIIEMKQMVSRPFTKLYIDLNYKQADQNNDNDFINQESLMPMPVAIEPLINNKTAILTVLLKLPDGGCINETYNEDTNDGTPTSPFVFGSTLIHYDPNEIIEQNFTEDDEIIENIEQINNKTVIIDDLNINLEEIRSSNNNTNNSNTDSNNDNNIRSNKNLISLDTEKNEAFV